MGANFVSQAISKSEVKIQNLRDACDRIIEREALEYGASYSGRLGQADGVVLDLQTFPSIREAKDWLDENCEKWGPMIVVQTPTDWVLGALCSS
jgi:hypothetical protein